MMRTLIRLIAVAVVLAIAGVVAAYAYIGHAAETPFDPTGAERPIELRVPKGATLNTLGPILESEKLIGNVLVWRVYVKMHGGPSPKAGRHPIHAGLNVPQLIERLAENPLSDDVPLTMVEGWRLRDADAWLAEKGLIEAGTYERAASNPTKYTLPFPFNGGTLEGYLYPETYMVPPGKLDVDKLIQRQIDKFAEKFWVPNKTEIEACGRPLLDLVKVASLLEREEPQPALRSKVAGVIYRRLDSRIPLGIDASSRYQLADWNDRKTFLVALRDAEDPYNTRHKAGLPPSPIGATSIESLLAALRPEKSNYLYYLHDAQRNIHFAATAEEHEANRKRYNVY